MDLIAKTLQQEVRCANANAMNQLSTYPSHGSLFHRSRLLTCEAVIAGAGAPAHRSAEAKSCLPPPPHAPVTAPSTRYCGIHVKKLDATPANEPALFSNLKNTAIKRCNTRTGSRMITVKRSLTPSAG